MTWLKDVQNEKKSQNVFKRREVIAVSRRENATIVMLKSTMWINVESQENHDKLLKWKRNWSNKDRS